jgi:hypothetical protein
MKNIMFAGIKGKVIESSPHNNYLVVELSDRVTIIGTFSNQFSWKEMPEISSGFESFITYIGVRSLSESKKVKEIVTSSGGYFHKNEQEPRSSKRVKGFPLELKVRGLNVDFVAKLVSDI